MLVRGRLGEADDGGGSTTGRMVVGREEMCREGDCRSRCGGRAREVSWLDRQRVQALVFFAVGLLVGVFAIVDGVSKGAVGFVVLGILIVGLTAHILYRGITRWRRGELPEFRSSDEMRQHARDRLRASGRRLVGRK